MIWTCGDTLPYSTPSILTSDSGELASSQRLEGEYAASMEATCSLFL